MKADVTYWQVACYLVGSLYIGKGVGHAIGFVVCLYLDMRDVKRIRGGWLEFKETYSGLKLTNLLLKLRIVRLQARNRFLKARRFFLRKLAQVLFPLKSQLPCADAQRERAAQNGQR